MKAQVLVLPALLAALHSCAGSSTPPEVGVSQRTEGHLYARRDAPATLDSAVAWLEKRATEMIRSCRRTLTNGMAAFPPQVGGGYEAFWLRDYAYMPANTEWEQTLGVKPGTYQNGAYWATPARMTCLWFPCFRLEVRGR